MSSIAQLGSLSKNFRRHKARFRSLLGRIRSPAQVACPTRLSVGHSHLMAGAQTNSQQLRLDVWNARADSKMNVVYVKNLIDKKVVTQRVFAILIPVLSGGTLAVWLSKSEPVLYVIIGVLVATLSAVQSVLKPYEAVPKLRQIYELRLAQERAWDMLWAKIDNGDAKRLLDEYGKLREADSRAEVLEAEFPRNSRLIRQAQDSVDRAEGRNSHPSIGSDPSPALPPGT